MVSTKRLPLASLGSEGELPPNHGMTQGTLAGVVRGLHRFIFQEHPQPTGDACTIPGTSLLNFPWIAALRAPAQQQAFHLAADRRHPAKQSPRHAKSSRRDTWAQCSNNPGEVMRCNSCNIRLSGLIVAVVDEGLKIPLQMGPAPLQSSHTPVHLGSVASHDAGELCP